MANNRMWLVCNECLPAPASIYSTLGDREGVPFAERPGIVIAKYYPSTSWYQVNEGKEEGDEETKLTRWMQGHTHDLTIWGSGCFRLEFEQEKEE